MADPTAVDIAHQIADGSIYNKWWFYIIWMGITAVGAAIGIWVQEKIRGDVSKEIWLTQESWREKYRLYQILISASEEIAAALWIIYTDSRVLEEMGSINHSSETDGLNVFPEHQEQLNAEGRANEKLHSAEVGVKLMLNDKANEAYQSIRSVNMRTRAVINMSYFQRIKLRCDAARKAKVDFINAAKDDLRI
jgi:hypothetical protein